MLLLGAALDDFPQQLQPHQKIAQQPLRKQQAAVVNVPSLDLSAQQQLIFAASSNNSRRRRQSELNYDEISILVNAQEGLIKPHLLQEASSFGEGFKAPGAVPFKWEAEPGKPKSSFSPSFLNSPTALQPPPCLSRDSSRRSSPMAASILQQIQTSPSQQNSSPRSLSEKFRSILQLGARSPLSSSSQHRSSPVSILDGFGTSPESSGSSPMRISSSQSFRFSEQVESPLSSGRLKKQLSLEIWDRSLRESRGSGSAPGCGFLLKHMITGCWQKSKSESSSESYSMHPALAFDVTTTDAPDGSSLGGGEFESFRDYEVLDYHDDDDDDDDELELEAENELQQQLAEEVHAVNDGEFAMFPVSAAFVFCKPALKKPPSSAEIKSSPASAKRVRFLIEDYSSNEEDDDNDVCDEGTSSEDEGFQRPPRSVIRRRSRKKSSSRSSSMKDDTDHHLGGGKIDISVDTSAASVVSVSSRADSVFSNAFLDADSSPDLQPMKAWPRRAAAEWH